MSQDESTFKLMQVSELAQMLGGSSDKSTPVIVDVRDPASFQNGHIKGASHLSNESVADFLRETDPDASVVVCCYHGNSSQQVAQYLVSQDFTDVYSLEGGFTQWQLQCPDKIEK